MRREERSSAAGAARARFAALLGAAAAIAWAALAVALPAAAANFSVTPTALELSASLKSGAFSVVNSGPEKLNCQIDVKEWSQDADGKDVYADAKDIIFFPKIMTVEPNEQRAIRIGIKVPAGTREKTYRLFVEEIPTQKKDADAKQAAKSIKAGLTIAFRYAIPIFVTPAKPARSAVVENVALSRGVASASVRNAGNVHVKLLSVVFRGKAADGKELFAKDMAGWYVLPGTSRPYEIAVPEQVCKDLAAVEVSAQAEGFSIDGAVHVDGTMCAP